jgi:S-adenosyl-L-methionine hydrolase (adenosine-forming)
MQPLITLTTDFGLADHYVAAMKGAILGIAPGARIVDISHEVEPYGIAEAAYLLAQTYPCFPKRTVHVVVVDPGVGSARRPILAQAAGQWFVAPDNGVLGMVFAREKHAVRHVTAERYFRRPVSQTFHGRDVFAPVAAHLAKGAAAARFGKTIQDHLRPAFARPEQTGKHFWTGAILKIDRFGNAITNFRIEDFGGLRERPFELQAGPHIVTRLASNYAEGAPGELFAIAGSAGYLEISANQASAARISGCASGAPVELRIF